MKISYLVTCKNETLELLQLIEKLKTHIDFVAPNDEVVILDDFSKFTPWYLLQGNTGNTSFPSGHTADAWAIIVVTLFISKEKIKLYRSALIAAIVWGTLVAISRVVIGAHFASDVTVGAAITIGIFFLLKLIVKDTNIINNRTT